MYKRQTAYALGASLGRYMENSLKEQEKLGIKLDKDQLIAGVPVSYTHLERRSGCACGRSLCREILFSGVDAGKSGEYYSLV